MMNKKSFEYFLLISDFTEKLWERKFDVIKRWGTKRLLKVDECIITIRLLLLNRIICLIEIEEIIIKIEAYKVVCLDHKFYKFSENLLSEFLKISVSALKKKISWAYFTQQSFFAWNEKDPLNIPKLKVLPT